MLLREPQPTPYDINFNLFGFPVRVNPLFFLMPLLLGGNLTRLVDGNTGMALLVIVAVFFVSILIHELGHALAFRWYGFDCHIVLYMMGGLAVPNSNWMSRRSHSLTPKKQIVIAFAGPLFGFILVGVLVTIVYVIGGKIVVQETSILPLLIPDLRESLAPGNQALWLFFFAALWANVFWNVLNLMPVFPLDGGQILRQLFIMFDPWDGVRKSLIVTIVAGALIALFALTREHPHTFLGIMFGYLAVMSYFELQQSGGRW